MPLRKRGAATTKNQCEKSSARTRCWRPSLPSRDVPGDFLDASRPVWLRETTRRASAIPGGEVTDKKGRWQSRYSEGAGRIREQKKYDRVVAFGRALPRMRQAIDRDMRLPGLPREKVMACIMRILSTCFMRPGSEAYAKENGSFGITTLQNRHASVHGDTVRFHYRGKAGKEQVNELRDRRVARIVRELKKVPGKDLFQYVAEDGSVVNVRRRHINDYIKGVMGERFSAKDFRTWAGTLIAACALARLEGEEVEGPVSAVLLAVELLLFELRPRSLIPVALAAAAAMAVRIGFVGITPAFAMPNIAQPGEGALAAYVLLGALVGVAAVAVTKVVYAIEDAFDHLPIHWMWWPAIGAVAVGVCGYFSPHTLGVGYDNIERILSGDFGGQALLVLGVLKFVSWSISGSGTSGGTLAPLFTIGGALGALLGEMAARSFPHLGLDPRIAALVGMAAMFAGASRALLASVVFAFETTRQPIGLLPLLGGCTASFLLSCLMMRNTIMTEKIARRGVRVPGEYAADFLDQLSAGLCASRPVVTLNADELLETVRRWISTHGPGTSHQGFPVVDGAGE